MELKDLKPAEGSKRNRKRVGRGPASGNGKTAGRGMNGQKSRSGGGKGAGFEGGQTPLARRLPKLPGFRNINRVEYLPVNVSRLDAKFERRRSLSMADTLVCYRASSSTLPTLVKVLGDGEITKALTVQVLIRFLLLRRAKIEAAGGKVEAALLSSLVQAFKVPELRKKILFTLGILALYRFGAYMPVPGIPFHAFADSFSEQACRYGDARPFHWRCFVELLGIRAGHHALHHRIDHHAADAGRYPSRWPLG